MLENTVIDGFACLGADAIDGEEPDLSARLGGEGCGKVLLSLKSKDSAGELKEAGEIETELYLACLGASPQSPVPPPQPPPPNRALAPWTGAGRKPRGRETSLDLEANGVELVEKSGHIFVGDNFETSQPGIYAAGDCIVGPALASTGVDQAQRAVVGMFNGGGGDSGDGSAPSKQAPFPIGVWTIPEVGYYGLTLNQALEQGYDADVGVATYDMCLRGRVFAPDGMRSSSLNSGASPRLPPGPPTTTHNHGLHATLPLVFALASRRHAQACLRPGDGSNSGRSHHRHRRVRADTLWDGPCCQARHAF